MAGAAGTSGPPTPSADGARRWGDRAGLAVRLLLLLVLATGAVWASGALHQPYRQQDELLANLAAGRVSYVLYEPATRRVRWVDGWWSWKQTSLETWEGGAGSSSEGSPSSTQDWLNRRLEASPRPVTLEIDNDQGPWVARWLRLVPWKPLRSAVTYAWWLTLLLMISRRTHRYANRWAWFWLFTVGQAGAVLYLVMEPGPIWRAGASSAAERTPISGGAGCGWSLLLSIALGLGAAGIAALL